MRACNLFPKRHSARRPLDRQGALVSRAAGAPVCTSSSTNRLPQPRHAHLRASQLFALLGFARVPRPPAEARPMCCRRGFMPGRNPWERRRARGMPIHPRRNHDRTVVDPFCGWGTSWPCNASVWRHRRSTIGAHVRPRRNLRLTAGGDWRSKLGRRSAMDIVLHFLHRVHREAVCAPRVAVRDGCGTLGARFWASTPAGLPSFREPWADWWESSARPLCTAMPRTWRESSAFVVLAPGAEARERAFVTTAADHRDRLRLVACGCSAGQPRTWA